MRSIRVHYNDGSTVETNINGTDDEIRRYYIGREFNLGDGSGGDRIAIATAVDFLDATYTREDYLNRKCTHDEFYAQYVTKYVRSVVLNHIGRDVLVKSTDPHFNDIPLATWDWLANQIRNHVAKENVRLQAYKMPASTLSDCVCVLKCAARQIAAESPVSK